MQPPQTQAGNSAPTMEAPQMQAGNSDNIKTMSASQSQPEYTEMVKITVSKLTNMEESLRRLDSKVPTTQASENDFKRIGD